MKNSPSLHLRCASVHVFPANLWWETTRYNESMRDHNHRICCYLNCSVSYLKNAHRCHVIYLKRAMMMMSMMLCTTRGWVLVLDGSRCGRHGMIALKATFSFSLLFSTDSEMSFLTMIMTVTCCVQLNKKKREADSSVGGKVIDFLLFLLAWLLLLAIYLQSTT